MWGLKKFNQEDYKFSKNLLHNKWFLIDWNLTFDRNKQEMHTSDVKNQQKCTTISKTERIFVLKRRILHFITV